MDIHDEVKVAGLHESHHISLLIDGATDSSNLDDEIVYVK